MKSMLHRALATVVFFGAVFVATHAVAQDDFVFWPNADYDPAIPTVEDVLGYVSGDRITWHRDAIRYFEALVEAAPNRISVAKYAHPCRETPACTTP